MKHDKILDALIELEAQVSDLSDFICKLEGTVIKKPEQEEKWGDLSLSEFLDNGALNIITPIFNKIGDINQRLRSITDNSVKEDSDFEKR